MRETRETRDRARGFLRREWGAENGARAIATRERTVNDRVTHIASARLFERTDGARDDERVRCRDGGVDACVEE